MTNLNIKFIDEQDNDVTFDVLANNSGVNIAEVQIPNLSIDKAVMRDYVTTVFVLLYHHQAVPIKDLLYWLLYSWDNQKEHGVVHRYLYDHIADCFCGVFED